MNDYIGKTCPFCRTEFKSGDEIVICSNCDMPHHKDCWIENHGCTTFGCLGTVKAVDDEETTVTRRQLNYEDIPIIGVTDGVYCTRCGAKNTNASFFCSQCGTRIINFAPSVQTVTCISANATTSVTHAYADLQHNLNPQQEKFAFAKFKANQENTEATDLQKLVGTNYEYYNPIFQELSFERKKASWNWSAFLVAPYWMIYRKMYGYGAALLGGTFLISLIGSEILSVLLLAGHFAIGLFANSIYMESLKDKATQCREMSEPYKTQFVSKFGGVNTVATVLAVVGYITLTILISV